MKASTITSTFTLLSTALASPLLTTRQASAVMFTFSLTNDITGLSASTSIPINAQPITLGALFGPWATPISQNGVVIATSAQNLNPGVMNIFCIFKDLAGNAIVINDKVTNADLDGDVGRAVETDVTGFTIECQQ